MNQPSFIFLPGRQAATADALEEDATTLLAHVASDAAVTLGHMTGAMVGALTAPFTMAATATAHSAHADT